MSSSEVPKDNPVLDPRYSSLFHTVETTIHSRTGLPRETWYILTMACLAASATPESAAQLYLYLTGQPCYAAPASRQALIRRLREVLMKCVPLVGVCKPLEAILAISAVEKPEDKDYSSTREGWRCDEANHARGTGWFEKLYGRNAEDTLRLFDAHKDFRWISTEITYGLYLSDRSVLDDLETQMVVLPAIMSQNLPRETSWHIRGTRRIGVAKGDVEVVCECVRIVAGFFGVSLDKVPYYAEDSE